MARGREIASGNVAICGNVRPLPAAPISAPFEIRNDIAGHRRRGHRHRRVPSALLDDSFRPPPRRPHLGEASDIAQPLAVAALLHQQGAIALCRPDRGRQCRHVRSRSKIAGAVACRHRHGGYRRFAPMIVGEPFQRMDRTVAARLIPLCRPAPGRCPVRRSVDPPVDASAGANANPWRSHVLDRGRSRWPPITRNRTLCRIAGAARRDGEAARFWPEPTSGFLARAHLAERASPTGTAAGPPAADPRRRARRDCFYVTAGGGLVQPARKHFGSYFVEHAAPRRAIVPRGLLLPGRAARGRPNPGIPATTGRLLRTPAGATSWPRQRRRQAA